MDTGSSEESVKEPTSTSSHVNTGQKRFSDSAPEAGGMRRTRRPSFYSGGRKPSKKSTSSMREYGELARRRLQALRADAAARVCLFQYIFFYNFVLNFIGVPQNEMNNTCIAIT